MYNPIKAISLLSLVFILGVTGCTPNGKLVQSEVSVIPKAEKKLDGITDKTAKLSIIDPMTTSHLKLLGIQTGRYTTIQAKPIQSQQHLLQVIISVTIPNDIQTIGQTVRYLLKRSGYDLVNPKPDQLKLTQLLVKRLPDVHRRLGPMTLADALVILTAPAFTLIDDPVHRLISYQLDDRYLGEAVL